MISANELDRTRSDAESFRQGPNIICPCVSPRKAVAESMARKAEVELATRKVELEIEKIRLRVDQPHSPDMKRRR